MPDGFDHECGKWAPDVMVAELPVSEVASTEFVAQVRAAIGARSLRIVGTGSQVIRIPSIDALLGRPFKAEEVARQVGSMIGEMCRIPWRAKSRRPAQELLSRG